MARSLRIEYASALYHVTVKSNASQDIFAVATLSTVNEHFGANYATVSRTVKLLDSNEALRLEFKASALNE